MLILSALAMAHVWGGKAPDFTLPRNIAVPLIALSQRLGPPPIVMHATLVLNNWRRSIRPAPLALDNRRHAIHLHRLVRREMVLSGDARRRTGRRAGDRCAGRCGDGRSRAGDDTAITGAFSTALDAGIRHMIAALMRMTERCDPYVFYNRIRPYLAGWPAPGLTYAGTGTTPQVWAGGSAAQSSLLQSFDAALGIRHEHAHHARLSRTPCWNTCRRSIARWSASCARRSTIRARARKDGSSALRDAYNACIAATGRISPQAYRADVAIHHQAGHRPMSAPARPGPAAPILWNSCANPGSKPPAPI